MQCSCDPHYIFLLKNVHSQWPNCGLNAKIWGHSEKEFIKPFKTLTSCKAVVFDVTACFANQLEKTFLLSGTTAAVQDSRF